ncbi:MAG: SGNH/GDSL hydrolase family protein [Verrucomicrobiae bacterium]|nr:SGNH/GDSL hydrolase family protein [Verrucomicrobiae bacterium]
MKIAPGSRLLFIGDSITDANRARPVGEADGLGTGYVALVNAFFQATIPHHRIRVLNTGISGNTVRDLKARWQCDVLDLQPHWVSVMIGINDVWRQFDRPLQPEAHVDADEYETTLDELVALTKPHVRGLVLMTPFYLEPNRQDPMRRKMDEYGRIVRQIARRHRTVFCDTQAAFDRVLTHVYPAALAWDRVHPNLTGHLILARAFLEAVGFAGL